MDLWNVFALKLYKTSFLPVPWHHSFKAIYITTQGATLPNVLPLWVLASKGSLSGYYYTSLMMMNNIRLTHCTKEDVQGNLFYTPDFLGLCVVVNPIIQILLLQTLEDQFE